MCRGEWHAGLPFCPGTLLHAPSWLCAASQQPHSTAMRLPDLCAGPELWPRQLPHLCSKLRASLIAPPFTYSYNAADTHTVWLYLNTPSSQCFPGCGCSRNKRYLHVRLKGGSRFLRYSGRQPAPGEQLVCCGELMGQQIRSAHSRRSVSTARHHTGTACNV